jgi:hypothetical protein
MSVHNYENSLDVHGLSYKKFGIWSGTLYSHFEKY